MRGFSGVRVLLRNADRRGSVVEMKGEAGSTLLETAWENKVETLEGACDHAMACSTCHVYVENLCPVLLIDWFGSLCFVFLTQDFHTSYVAKEDWNRLAPPSEEEMDMLDLAFEPKENSRLACQIVLSPSIDGLVAEVRCVI